MLAICTNFKMFGTLPRVHKIEKREPHHFSTSQSNKMLMRSYESCEELYSNRKSGNSSDQSLVARFTCVVQKHD